VSFFESRPPEPEVEQPRHPEWLAAAENVLPAPFPLWLVLAQTDEVALAIHGGLAYPNGFAFTLLLRRHRARDGRTDDPIHYWHTARGGEIPPEALRLGVQFGDGSKATVFDGHRWYRTTERPEVPVLVQRGGNGSTHSWELGFWVWPLPPPGSVSFVCEWPVENVPLTAVDIDSETINEAAGRAQILWADETRSGGTAGASYSVIQSVDERAKRPAADADA